MATIADGAGRQAVVLLSGGLDSMVTAALAREAGYRIHALTIDYSQRHRREIDAARASLATKAGSEGGNFAIHAPLQLMAKADIAREAYRLGLDPAMSWSCYDPEPDGRACGRCDSCRLRRAGFAEAGLEDSTEYAA